MSQEYNAAIEKLREQLAASIEAIKEDPKMAEVLKLHAALNTMEQLTDLAPTSLAAAFALEPAMMIVQPGDFYGMNPLKAAKRFLRKRGKPASINEIVAAVRAGGVTVNSIEKLRISLGRSTSDVAKVGPDHYGLLEFYPHVQRGKKGKGAAENGQSESELLSLEDEDEDNDEEASLSPPPLSLEDEKQETPK